MDRKFVFILDTKNSKRYFELNGKGRKAISKSALTAILEKLGKTLEDVKQTEKITSVSSKKSENTNLTNDLFFNHLWKKKNDFHVFSRYSKEYKIKMTLNGTEYTFITPQHAYEASLQKENKIAISAILSTVKPTNIVKALKQGNNSKDFADDIKITEMTQVYKVLINQHEDLKDLLKSTKEKNLHEFCQFGGFWGTNYKYGTSEGKGDDNIGKILTDIRSSI